MCCQVSQLALCEWRRTYLQKLVMNDRKQWKKSWKLFPPNANSGIIDHFLYKQKQIYFHWVLILREKLAIKSKISEFISKFKLSPLLAYFQFALYLPSHYPLQSLGRLFQGFFLHIFSLHNLKYMHLGILVIWSLKLILQRMKNKL